MRGWRLQDWRKNAVLVPIFVCSALGAYLTYRQFLLLHPDVAEQRKSPSNWWKHREFHIMDFYTGKPIDADNKPDKLDANENDNSVP